jgi:hypothetical protein
MSKNVLTYPHLNNSLAWYKILGRKIISFQIVKAQLALNTIFLLSPFSLFLV